MSSREVMEEHKVSYFQGFVQTGKAQGFKATPATFSSFEKVSQLTVKECILNSAPRSCELVPIASKLLTECLDYIIPSLTDVFSSSLASSHNASNQLLSHLFSKRCLDKYY